jgi:NAD(P)-dependent dehydrogenase (short-subunit alcohol dehydrogenase family)
MSEILRPPERRQREAELQQVVVPEAESAASAIRPAGYLRDRLAVITGGESGIGRAVAVAFAREGADVTIVCCNENEDSAETARLVESEERTCLTIAGDVGDEAFCREAIGAAAARYDRTVAVLVNNAAEQHPLHSLEELSAEQLERTFRTNVFGMFFMSKAVLPHMRPGSSIVNTASVTAYSGNPDLVDYAATKGAVVAFTRSLSQQLARRNIRVNAVAPGPIWTPLMPASYGPEEVAGFGKEVPFGRAGHPAEVAPAFVFLASDLATYITGQTLHVNGGTIVNG